MLWDGRSGRLLSQRVSIWQVGTFNCVLILQEGVRGPGKDHPWQIKTQKELSKILRVVLWACFSFFPCCSCLEMTLERSSCATTLIQRNAQVFFNTSFFPPPSFFFFFFFYRLAPRMHVIDCFRWPETSSRFTSACNYWPPLLVSQCCVCVCVCVCTCICHTLTINWLPHLFWVVPDTAWGGKLTTKL